MTARKQDDREVVSQGKWRRLGRVSFFGTEEKFPKILYEEVFSSGESSPKKAATKQEIFSHLSVDPLSVQFFIVLSREFGYK